MRSAIAGNGNRLWAVHARSALASRSGNRPGVRRAAQRIALDFAALDRVMSAKELSVLRAGLDSKAGAEGTIAAVMDTSAMPRTPDELSILPVRGLVIFPGTIIPLNIQRPASLKLLDDTLPRTKVIGLLTQRDAAHAEH